jgi:hypothetical protein
MKGIVRLSGLVLAVVIGLVAMTAVAAPPAQADQSSHVVAASTPAEAPPAHVTGPVHAPGPHQMTTGGCGLFQVCLYFNKSEQKWIGGASVSAVAALVCTSPIACAAAAAIAYALIKSVDKHGVCSKSRPRLRVKVFPTASFQPSCVD